MGLTRGISELVLQPWFFLPIIPLDSILIIKINKQVNRKESKLEKRNDVIGN